MRLDLARRPGTKWRFYKDLIESASYLCDPNPRIQRLRFVSYCAIPVSQEMIKFVSRNQDSRGGIRRSLVV
jgi:hypothetical protein